MAPCPGWHPSKSSFGAAVSSRCIFSGTPILVLVDLTGHPVCFSLPNQSLSPPFCCTLAQPSYEFGGSRQSVCVLLPLPSDASAAGARRRTYTCIRCGLRAPTLGFDPLRLTQHSTATSLGSQRCYCCRYAATYRSTRPDSQHLPSDNAPPASGPPSARLFVESPPSVGFSLLGPGCVVVHRAGKKKAGYGGRCTLLDAAAAPADIIPAEACVEPGERELGLARGDLSAGTPKWLLCTVPGRLPALYSRRALLLLPTLLGCCCHCTRDTSQVPRYLVPTLPAYTPLLPSVLCMSSSTKKVNLPTPRVPELLWV